VAAGDIVSVSPTLVELNATLNTAGAWKVAVANPASAPTGPLTFTVAGSPAVTAINPAAPVHNNAAQTITLTGTGFMSGLTVVFKQAGHADVPAKVTSVTAQNVVVSVILDAQGIWHAMVTNPGNLAAPAFDFTAT
jgi:hypothetical protein